VDGFGASNDGDTELDKRNMFVDEQLIYVFVFVFTFLLFFGG